MEEYRDMNLKQEDFEAAAIIYDNIRELYQEESATQDEILANQFDDHIKSIILDNLLQNSEENEFQSNMEMLNIKEQLFQTCYDAFQEFLKSVDPRLVKIYIDLNKQKEEMVKDHIFLAQQQVISVSQEVQRFQQENMDLRDDLIAQKEENKQYLDMLQKLKEPQIKQMPTQQKYRIIPLKQLKDTLQDIYSSKQKYDLKKNQLSLPSETLEYTYLSKKYGLKHLVLEQAGSIIQSIGQYAHDDIDVQIFGKMLKNQCDEEFQYVINQVRSSLAQIIKQHFKKKYVFKSQGDIQKMVEHKMRTKISTQECEEIIRYMYNEEHADQIIQKLNFNDDQLKMDDLGFTRQQLREQVQKVEKLKKQIDFSYFEKIILEFLLIQHEQFLQNFIQLFQSVDQDQDGIIDENEFLTFIDMIPTQKEQSTIGRFLQILDPLNQQKITFSNIISLLSSEYIDQDNRKVSYLQFLSELS